MSYQFTASTLVLLVFTFVLLAPGYGDGGEVFFDWNVTEEDLRVVPEVVDRTPSSIDLSDTYERQNVTIVDSSEINNTEYNTSQALTLEDGASSGYAIYSTPDIAYVEFQATTSGFFESSGVNIQELDAGLNEVYASDISGSTSGETESTTQYLKVNLDKPDAVMYDIKTATVPPSTGIDRLFSLGGNLIAFPVTLWTMFSYFPLIIQLFYAGMLTYMVIDILQVG